MWPWFAVAVLGACHGLDPSMGWLFGVAPGLQDRSRARVVGALGPIAIGHLLSIASVVAIIVGLSTSIREATESQGPIQFLKDGKSVFSICR